MNIAFLKPRPPRMSLDDFEDLLSQKPEDEKWELIDGRVIKSMVSARWEHHFIIRNCDFAILTHLRAKGLPCTTFRETFFVRQKLIDLSALPDLMVRCGPIAPGVNAIEDPSILIEVVSPGSEERDRCDKRLAYQQLDSLDTFVLIERDRMLVDVYQRTAEGFVSGAPLITPEAKLLLPSIGFEMTLGEVYRDVGLLPA